MDDPAMLLAYNGYPNILRLASTVETEIIQTAKRSVERLDQILDAV